MPAATREFVGAALADGYRVFILDNRGRGLSQGLDSLSYRFNDYAADTQGVIASLGLQKPTIVGHSMGARIVAQGRSPKV